MGKDYCQHGCYPIDKRWHGGISIDPGEFGDMTDGEVAGEEAMKRRLGSDVYSGGNLEINDIFDLRAVTDAFGPEAGEWILNNETPSGEPYVRGAVGDDRESVDEKIKKRGISISTIGQGPEMDAYLDAMDMLSTHFKFSPVSKVVDSMWATPQSQVHQELVQRRQQAEQQINRTLGNLADLYQQKQLLEHDLRKLEARLEHVENKEKADAKGEERDTQDELKADFINLVDQHVGRHSILQMQANDVFPSITADFYSMTQLEDLEPPDGHLKNLPESEKAVLRKKWKLYEKWKEQFQTAVKSRYNDVKRRLNSVLTSIEQTENWIKPYVQDIKRITDDWDAQFELSENISKYLPISNANVYRSMKVIAVKDQSPVGNEDLYYDVVVWNGMHGSLPSSENPQAAGQGLTLFSSNWYEYLMCKHVYEAVFGAQIENKANEVREYIDKYVGEEDLYHTKDEIEEKKDELRDRFVNSGSSGKGGGKSKVNLTFGGLNSDDVEERIEQAHTMEQLEEIEQSLERQKYKPGLMGRKVEDVKSFFGMTDEFYHPEPEQLRRELIGPGFPTQFYLDYKYSNGLFVMK